MARTIVAPNASVWKVRQAILSPEQEKDDAPGVVRQHRYNPGWGNADPDGGIVMAVKLIDLQLIYGLGAREKFEDLAFDLIKADEPRAQKVRVSQGDGGIDAHVSDLSDPGGVHVYQCKFFPRGLKDTQKGQIRESFKRCRDSKDYKLKHWTLCLPVDLSLPERLWFERWRDDQKSSGVVIDDPWGSSILENLLHLDKNKGLRDVYFKEEFIAQIGDMHGTLHRLDARVEEIRREREAERSQTKQLGVVERQDHFVEQLMREVRQEHVELLQQANRLGPQPAQWEVVIHASWVPEHPRFASLRDCLGVLRTCEVELGQVRYPELRFATHTTGQDWVGGAYAQNGDVECWHFATRGVFVQVFTVPEGQGTPAVDYQHCFAVDQAVLRLTQFYRFAKHLAEKAFDANDGTVKVTIRLSGIRGRTLVLPSSILRGDLRGGQDQIEYVICCPRDELLRVPDAFAIKAAIHFFERFKWFHVTEQSLARVQADCIRHF